MVRLSIFPGNTITENSKISFNSIDGIICIYVDRVFKAKIWLLYEDKTTA